MKLINILTWHTSALRHISNWRDKQAFAHYRIGFYEDLARSIDDKLGRLEFLNAELANVRKSKQTRVARVLAQVIKRLPDNYGQIAGALRGFIPDTERMVLVAAERNPATLPENLFYLAEQASKDSEIQTSLRLAISAPAFTMAINGFTLYTVSSGMTPLLEQMPDSAKHDGMSLALVWLADFSTNFGIPLVLLSVAVLLYAIWQMPRKTGRTRRRMDEWPILSMYRDYQGARLLKAFTSLTKAGVGQREALETIAATATPYVRWHCNTLALGLVRHADQPGNAWACGVLNSRTTARIISLGNRGSGNFSIALERIGLSVTADTAKAILATTNRIGLTAEGIAALVLFIITLGMNAMSSSVSSMSSF